MTRFKRVLAALFCSAFVSSHCFSQTSPPATDPPQTSATPQPVPISSPRGFGRGGPPVPAYEPSQRTDRNSQLAHEQLLEKSKQGGIDIYFEGDSIARRWGTSDAQYKDFLANWNENFFGWNAADFGWGADTIQNILWRLNNGELDGVNPKIIVVLAGTNNVGRQRANDAKVEEISRGLKAIIDICQTKAPRQRSS